MAQKITVAYGDGIGPEIMTAVLKILKAGGADFEEDVIEVGEKVYRSGCSSGIRPQDWQKLKDNKFFLKGPVTTPQGGGFKSLNVTIRGALGLFANIRPARSLSPFVPCPHPKMNLVIVRENEEDLYTGIEYRQTHEVFQCLKLISRPGSEKISRYAFEYARRAGRKKVTCMTKDNIMKMTDGLFHKVFLETAKNYPDIESEHWIIDIGAAKMVTDPSRFDIILLPNLYGDILSDIAVQMAGSVGLGGSGNIGAECAMFEAIHGSAPRRAGQNTANPSGLLQAGLLLLSHIGQGEAAEKIHNSWLKTLEDGIHTYDIFNKELSKAQAGTKEFAAAVIDRLGERPSSLSKTSFAAGEADFQKSAVRAGKNLFPRFSDKSLSKNPRHSTSGKTLLGADVFFQNSAKDLAQWIEVLKTAAGPDFSLSLIANRGAEVYPQRHSETFLTDHFRCRFLSARAGRKEISWKEIANLLSRLSEKGLETIKVEGLFSFNGDLGWSLMQGESSPFKSL